MSDTSSVASERNESVSWTGAQHRVLDTYQERWNDAPDSREVRRGFVTELVIALQQLELSPPEENLSKVRNTYNSRNGHSKLIKH